MKVSDRVILCGLATTMVIALLFISRALYVHWGGTNYVSEQPATNITVKNGYITVIPLADTKLEDLVDMALFHDFTPDIDFDEAISLYGKPSNIRTDKSYRYLEYWYDDSTVEIGAFLLKNRPTDWTLTTNPVNKSYRDILPIVIAKHIDISRDENIVQILNVAGDDIRMIVQIVGGRVEQITWIQ